MTELQIAIETARAAAALVLQRYQTGPEIVMNKTSAADLVTEVDLASEAFILQTLRRHFPEHGVLAEETASQHPNTDAFWIVDPLDGTTNFAHRFPVFAVTLALWHQNQVQLGVTVDVVRQRCYWAERGAGAWCDGRQLHVTTTDKLEQTLLATGFPYSRATNPDNNLAEFNHFVPLCHGVRRAGSAALDLAWLAEGCFDGYWEAHLKPWDWAAGALLVEEAGGQLTSYAGESWKLGDHQLVASNGQPALHRALLDGIRVARMARAERG